MSDYAAKLSAMDNGTLNPAEFSHRDHVGVTILALQQGDFYDALARISRGLRDLTKAAGVPEKFNATLTFAFVSVIAEALPDEIDDIDRVIDAHPEMMAPGAISTLYGAERMQSDIARKLPVLPLAV